MHTPHFPNFRCRLAALGRRTTHLIRQATLAQLEEHLRDFLPAPLLSAEDEGPNSQERIFSLRLTFECFLWQLFKPKTSCRGGGQNKGSPLVIPPKGTTPAQAERRRQKEEKGLLDHGTTDQ